MTTCPCSLRQCLFTFKTTEQLYSVDMQHQTDQEHRKNLVLKQIFSSPEILEQILPNLCFDRQKIYRLVSKTWNKELCRILSHGAVFVIRRMIDLPLIQGILDSREIPELPHPFWKTHVLMDLAQVIPETLLQHQPMLLRIPVTKLTLTCTGNATGKLLESLISLISVSSSSLTHLCTKLFKLAPEALDQLTFPNLVALKILKRNRDLTTQPKYVQFFLAIMSHAPKLTELELDGGSTSTPALLREADLRKIRKLVILGTFIGDLSSVLIDKNFEELISFQYSGIVWSAALPRVVAFNPASLCRLKTLKIFSNDMLWKLPWTGVTRLEIGDLVLGSVHLNSLPHLKFLKVKTLLGSTSKKTEVKDWSISRSCTKVEFSSFGDRASRGYVLRHLFTHFPEARDVCIPFTLLDSFFVVLSGVRKSDERRIQRLRVRLDSRTLCQTNNVDLLESVDVFTFYQLKLLQGLQRLDLLNGDNLPKGCCMRIGAIQFQHLPNIKVLNVTTNDITELLTLSTHLQSLEKVTVTIIGNPRRSLDEEYFLFQMPNVEFKYKTADFPQLRD